MPVADHFSPKIRAISRFHSFHNAWATHIAVDLNALLPSNFIAELNAQIGSLIEIDVQATELLTEGENNLSANTKFRPRPRVCQHRFLTKQRFTS